MKSSDANKVLMLTQYLHMGGLERMILNLSTALKSEGRWEPHVFVFDRLPDAEPENDLGPEFAKEGIPVTVFLKPKGFSFQVARQIARKLSADGIAVLHTHDLGALIYGVFAKLLSFGRIRLIHTQHSFIHFSRRKIYKYYERIFTRFADEITVVSQDTERSYMELGVAQTKIHLVPNGVRFPEQFLADKKEKRTALVDTLSGPARAAIEPFLNCRWLLYLARLHRVKGQNHALELWRSLAPAARKKCALLFIGPESETGQLEQLRSGISAAPDSSRILYLGSTRIPELWLGGADVMLSCSEFEGMPLGAIEAAGAGLPLVLSEIPGHEVVKPWSSQYPLGAPAEGAFKVERMLEKIEENPEMFFKQSWEQARDIRSRYALQGMSRAYSTLYGSSGCNH